jgi:hypothetical protein
MPGRSEHIDIPFNAMMIDDARARHKAVTVLM